MFLDGSLFSETAALSEDYCAHAHGADRGSGARDGGHGAGDAHRGYFQADPDHLRQQILAAYRSGWSIAAHAIGDRAVDLALALDVITECRQLYGPPTLPNLIEHATVTRPEHLAKMVAAQVAVTPQSSFFRSMGDAMTASLGPERATTPTAGPGTQAQPPTGAPHRRALLDRSLEIGELFTVSPATVSRALRRADLTADSDAAHNAGEPAPGMQPTWNTIAETADVFNLSH